MSTWKTWIQSIKSIIEDIATIVACLMQMTIFEAFPKILIKESMDQYSFKTYLPKTIVLLLLMHVI